MEKQSSSSEATIQDEHCRLSAGILNASSRPFLVPLLPLAEGIMSWWGCPTAEADTSSSPRTAVLLQSYVGVTAPGPAAVLVFTLPLSTGKRLVFLFSSLKPILAETLEADGTFLKDAGPYLPPSSHSETILLGPPSWTVQVSSCHSLL